MFGKVLIAIRGVISLRILRSCRYLDIPVVAPISSAGKTLHHSGPFRVSVSPRKGGRAPDLDDRDLMRHLGRLVARIHVAGESSEFEHRPSISVES